MRRHERLIGLILTLIFGIAVVTIANTILQSLQIKPSQQIPQLPFSKERLLNTLPFDPAV